MISETAYSSQTKLIGLNLHVLEHGIGYSNLTPDLPWGQGHSGVILGVKFKFNAIKKVVSHVQE